MLQLITLCAVIYKECFGVTTIFCHENLEKENAENCQNYSQVEIRNNKAVFSTW